MRNKSTNPKVGGSRGFTLVELLLAITLMSILLALAYGGLRAATRSAEKGEIILAESGDIRAAHQFVRRQINQMLPLMYSAGDAEGAGIALDASEVGDAGGVGSDGSIRFEGYAESIQFVAQMPGYLGTGGPQVQLLELAPGDDGLVLQFSHALLQGFEQEFLFERAPVILVEGIESAYFEFLGDDETGESTGWTSVWDLPDILPVAVRLSVQMNESSRLQWPDLVAGVRIDESALNGGAEARSYQQTIQDLMKRKTEDSGS